MTFAELASLFLSHKARDSAVNTQKFYRTQVNRLLPYFGPREIDSIKPGDILVALDKSGQNQANASRRATAIGVQQLQKFALENSLMDRAWLAKIPKPSIDQRTRIPTAEETRAILSKAHKRFRIVYQALRSSGARPNELARAQIADYDQKKRAIVLRSHKTARKTGRPRIIPVGTKLARLIRISIGQRKTGPIFTTPRGVAWTVNNLSTQFKRLRDAAGISPELVLYSARHEAGTEFCRKQGILMASRLLGHANINTTQRYVHPDLQELLDAQDDAELG
jgi:integrase